MEKFKTFKFALLFSLLLTILILLVSPLFRFIAYSPFRLLFATKVDPEVVGFTGDSANQVIRGAGYIIADGIAYIDNIMVYIAICSPIYLLALIYIIVFLKCRPKSCGIFALPISFILLPVLMFGLILMLGRVLLGRLYSMDEWAWLGSQVIIPLYSIPLFVITLCIAIYIIKRRDIVKKRTFTIFTFFYILKRP